jgi:serine phosphatase RsbU (regulator of sigma subunit)
MGGPMFCGMEQQVYLEGIHTLQADDVFVTVTDGISEASIDRRAEQFGLEGIICCLSKNAVASAACIATAILDDATRFANGTLHDDASIVVIKTDGNYNR